MDSVRGKDGACENRCPSRVVLNIVNSRGVWNGEDGNAPELLRVNVGHLSSIGGGEDNCARGRTSLSQMILELLP